MEKAQSLGWEVVRRPTGGGIVFHNEAEVTYSLVTGVDGLPAGLISSFKKISEAVIIGLGGLGIRAEIREQSPDVKSGSRPKRRDTGLCFSYPAEYEIVVSGRKIVGAAQKRGKKALLQQGSVYVRKEPDDILSMLKKPIDKKVYRENAISVEEVLGREVGFEELSGALVKGFREKLGVKIVEETRNKIQ